jgi:WD40 repeat protein
MFTFSDDNFQVSTDTQKAILSPDGQYACVGSQDGSLVFWNTTSGICETVLKKKHKYEKEKTSIDLLLPCALEQWSLQSHGTPKADMLPRVRNSDK